MLKLTVAQLPSNYGSCQSVFYGSNSGAKIGHATYWGHHDGKIVGVSVNGGNGNIDVMPAYQTLYAWRRTA